MTVKERETTGKEMVAGHKQELAGAEATRPGRVFTPAVDIFETESAITVLADMPGVTAAGLTLDLRDNVLTIDGQVASDAGKGEQVLHAEYDTGSYHREFRLSKVIDQAKIDASLRDGVLRVTLPKAEAARPRRIQVQTT
jgi:HSP20 family molecular chaperone IbpA